MTSVLVTAGWIPGWLAGRLSIQRFSHIHYHCPGSQIANSLPVLSQGDEHYADQEIKKPVYEPQEVPNKRPPEAAVLKVNPECAYAQDPLARCNTPCAPIILKTTRQTNSQINPPSSSASIGRKPDVVKNEVSS